MTRRRNVDESLFEMVIRRGWFKKQTIMYYESQEDVAYSIMKDFEFFLKDASIKEIKVKRFGHAIVSEKPISEPDLEPEPEETPQPEVEASSIQTCPICDAELIEKANFCSECGASVSPPTEAEKPEEKKPPTITSVTYDEDLVVYDYITQHEGTISLKQAAKDLGITLKELKKSIKRLKKSGKLAET